MTFYEEVQGFSTSLTHFVRSYDLPMELFVSPDHLAIKARNRADFDAITNAWREHALGGVIHAIDMDGRTLASLRTAQSIAVEPFGSVSWLEIMQPRVHKVGQGVVGLEHIEFYVPSLDDISRVLSRHDVPGYEFQSNPGHSWVSVVFNQSGQEIKFNDKPLAAVIRDEVDQELCYML